MIITRGYGYGMFTAVTRGYGIIPYIPGLREVIRLVSYITKRVVLNSNVH